jgi:hypothetical protein
MSRAAVRAALAASTALQSLSRGADGAAADGGGAVKRRRGASTGHSLRGHVATPRTSFVSALGGEGGDGDGSFEALLGASSSGAASGEEASLQERRTPDAALSSHKLPSSGVGGEQHENGERKYKGVSRIKSRGGWAAFYYDKGEKRSIWLEVHGTAAAAAHAYDAAARARGDSVVNFPRPGSVETEPAQPTAGGGGGSQPRGPVSRPDGVQKYKGVSWHKDTGTWQVVWWNPEMNTQESVGFFPIDQADAAAHAYDNAARGRGLTVVNFPSLPGETQAQPGEFVHRPGSSSTDYKGVTKKKSGKFEAKVYVRGYRIEYLGLHDTAEEAARAYDECMRTHGFRSVNFPRPNTDEVQAKIGVPPQLRATAAAVEEEEDETDAPLAADVDDDAAATPPSSATTPPDGTSAERAASSTRNDASADAQAGDGHVRAAAAVARLNIPGEFDNAAASPSSAHKRKAAAKGDNKRNTRTRAALAAAPEEAVNRDAEDDQDTPDAQDGAIPDAMLALSDAAAAVVQSAAPPASDDAGANQQASQRVRIAALEAALAAAQQAARAQRSASDAAHAAQLAAAQETAAAAQARITALEAQHNASRNAALSAEQASRAHLAAHLAAQEAWQARNEALAAELERAQSAAEVSDAAHAAQLADAEARAAAHSARNAATTVRIKRERAEGAEAEAAAAAHARDANAAALERTQRDVARSARNAAACIAEAHEKARVKQEQAEQAAAAEAAATAAAQSAQKELYDATVCTICFDAKRDTRFFQCGHLLCTTCGPRLEHCPHRCCVEAVRGNQVKSLRTKMKPRLDEPQRVY